MEVIFIWVVLGLCTSAILAGIRQIRQIHRERAAAAAEIERQRQEWMRTFEHLRSSSYSALRSKAESSGFRVIK